MKPAAVAARLALINPLAIGFDAANMLNMLNMFCGRSTSMASLFHGLAFLRMRSTYPLYKPRFAVPLL
jgi:hypothetical protein